MLVQIEIQPKGRRDLMFLLNRLVAIDLHLMRTRRLPTLYSSGVRYGREKKRGTEHWQAADELIKSGVGDCEDLACYRVAELRANGEYANVRLTKRRKTWHVTVRREDGTVEDPSRRLGMQ
jgi:hypothetical protein